MGTVCVPWPSHASQRPPGWWKLKWPGPKLRPFASATANRNPGQRLHYATAIDLGGSALGLLVTSLDGRPIKSCTMFGVQADGREVTTVEGLLQDGQLHPIQAAFKQEHGLQCGFCTPGMMLTGSALLAENPSPSEDEVRWAISGNICRCTGYMNIVKAIQAAGRDMAAGPAETADATVAS